MKRSWMAQIDEWLASHRREIIQDLADLVGIPSISQPDSEVPPFGQPCREVLQHMFRLGQRHGYSGQNYDDYVGQIVFTEGATSIGFWAHLDVVPPGDEGKWTYPPFHATVVEDRFMIGRGVQDNKSPAIGVFHVMHCLRQLGIPLRHGYSLYLGTNEECGMEDIKYFVKHHPCPDLSIVPDSGFPVCYGQRGLIELEVSMPFAPSVLFTTVGHPSVTPEQVLAQLPDGTTLCAKGHSHHLDHVRGNPSAIPSMLYQLQSYFPHQAQALAVLADACGQSTGEGLGMAFQDEASGPLLTAPTGLEAREGRLRVSLRAVVPVTADADALGRRAAGTAMAKGLQVEVVKIRPPSLSPREHPVVSVLTDVYNQVGGADAAPFIMSGSNYAAVLPRAFGFGPGMPGREFPAHIFQPGRGDYHQYDESEDLDRLFTFMRVYAGAVLALDEMEGAEFRL